MCCLSVQPPLYAALAGRFAGLSTNSQPTRPHREGSAHGWRTASAKHIAMENRLSRWANCWATCCSNSSSLDQR